MNILSRKSIGYTRQMPSIKALAMKNGLVWISRAEAQMQHVTPTKTLGGRRRYQSVVVRNERVRNGRKRSTTITATITTTSTIDWIGCVPVSPATNLGVHALLGNFGNWTRSSDWVAVIPASRSQTQTQIWNFYSRTGTDSGSRTIDRKSVV